MLVVSAKLEGKGNVMGVTEILNLLILYMTGRTEVLFSHHSLILSLHKPATP